MNFNEPTHYPVKECEEWRRKWAEAFPLWRQPVGLEKYSAFMEGWGFQMYGGYGWVMIDPSLCRKTGI